MNVSFCLSAAKMRKSYYIAKSENFHSNIKMTLCDPEMTLKITRCQSPYRKRFVTVINNYFNIYCCLSAEHKEKKKKYYTAAEFEIGVYIPPHMT